MDELNEKLNALPLQTRIMYGCVIGMALYLFLLQLFPIQRTPFFDETIGQDFLCAINNTSEQDYHYYNISGRIYRMKPCRGNETWGNASQTFVK